MIKKIAFIALCLLTCAYIYTSKLSGDDARITGGGVPPDALQFIYSSQNLLGSQDAVVKDQIETTNAPSLKLTREPVFPALLKGIFLVIGEPSDNQLVCLTSNGENCSSIRYKLKRYYGLVMVLLGLSAGWIFYKLSSNLTLSYLALLFASTSQALWLSTAQLLSEPLSSLCLLWVAYLFRLSYVSERIWPAIAVGVLAAILSLLKIAFLPLLLSYGAVISLSQVPRVQQKLASKCSTHSPKAPYGIWTAAKKFSLVCVGFLLISLSWSYLKSNQQEAPASAANRGASVLTTRANYDQMTWQEYRSSFVYWSSAAGPKFAARLLEPPHYENLDRSNPNGYFQRGAEGLHDISPILSDDRTQKFDSSISQMLDSPLKHLLVTIPIFYRGLFVETGFDLGRSSIGKIELSSAMLVGPCLFLALFLCLRLAWQRGDWPLLMFFTPVLYSLAFHSLLTHNIPRYGYPLIPLLVIAALIWAHDRLFRKPTQDNSKVMQASPHSEEP